MKQRLADETLICRSLKPHGNVVGLVLLLADNGHALMDVGRYIGQCSKASPSLLILEFCHERTLHKHLTAVSLIG